MPQGTNIIDVHADSQEKHLVQGRIDKKVFEYFFQRCLTGDRGPRQAFITHFYQRFYEACVLDGIAPTWDEDNERRINAVLQRLNFNERKRPTKPRRTNTPPAVDPA